ncbi:MAG: DUF6265 family protein [Ferruginibacter sp.]
MKRTVFVILILIGLSAFIHRYQNGDTFSQLYALEGTWKMETKKGILLEEWKLVHKDYMQSRGCFIKGTDTTVNEKVALENKTDGIFYTSTVEEQNNKQPVPFRLTSSENKIFIFENTEHDFPKRIVYELISRDSLHAWIDDAEEASKKRQDFYYHRVN